MVDPISGAVPPEQYQPPLHWYSHAWRYLACAAISAIGWSTVQPQQWHEQRLLFWGDILLGVAAFVIVWWRRRKPLTIAVVLGLASIISGIAAGPATLAAVSLATRRVVWQVVVVGLISLAAGQIYPEISSSDQEEPLWLSIVANTLITIGIMGWGMFIGSRRELMWTLRDRAERAEAERDLRVDSAKTHERARIAREMHDVLAHRISQVSMHAGALAFREDLSADELRSGVEQIQARANEALTDLRAVLGVLRGADGEVLDKPQPTYRDLPALVTELRETGMQVEYDDFLDEAADVPDSVGRTVYRIVQEGLTNARKHAPGAVVRVQLSGSPEDGVDVLVRNPVGFASAPAAPGAGLGLVGLRERAELRGGRLEHRRDGSTFVLHGWIPWAA